MSLQVRYNSATEVADVVTIRMGASFSMAAEEGAVAQSQIVVDDTGSTLNYKGLRRLYAYETACQAHNQMVFNGYLQERAIGRQPAEGQDQDEAIMALDRRWNLTVADTNSLMSRRLITGADGNRPEETDISRIQWLLDSNDAYLSNPQDTWENPSPYIDTTGPITMSAADLRGQTAFDALNDAAQRSGKLWFAAYLETNDTVPPTNNGSIALHYYKDSSAYYSSTLRLTNVNAEADNVTTFYVLPDALLDRSPARNYSGVYLTFDGPGSPIYIQSTVVENLFQRRDAAVNNPNVKTVAEATALANRYLADAATEDDRLTCRFIVAKQYVNDLREGQRFQARFSHFTEHTAFGYWRCLRRTVTQLNDEFYEIAIEATPAVDTLFTGDAFAGMLVSHQTTPYDLDYSESGDAPPSGWYATPTVGPLARVQTSTPYSTILCSEDMLLRIVCVAAFDTVVTNEHHEVTLYVKQNGVAIGQTTVTSEGGGWAEQMTIDLRDVLVANGDILSFSHTGTAAFLIGGWGALGANDQYFRAGRGTHVWNSGTVTWTGP